MGVLVLVLVVGEKTTQPQEECRANQKSKLEMELDGRSGNEVFVLGVWAAWEVTSHRERLGAPPGMQVKSGTCSGCCRCVGNHSMIRERNNKLRV